MVKQHHQQQHPGSRFSTLFPEHSELLMPLTLGAVAAAHGGDRNSPHEFCRKLQFTRNTHGALWSVHLTLYF